MACSRCGLITSHSSLSLGETSAKSDCTPDMQKTTPKICCLTCAGGEMWRRAGMNTFESEHRLDTLIKLGFHLCQIYTT